MKQNIILLHGLFGQLSNWNKVIARFNANCNIYVPSLPIYGAPQHDHLNYLTDYLENYIKDRQLTDVILAGNSLGGHVAILYTSRNEHNVKGLVLTGSSGLYENTNLGTFPRRNSYQYVKEKVAYTFHDPAMATEALVAEVMEVTTDSRKCLCAVRMARSAQRHYVADLLPHINTPTLLIWGKEDRITPIHVAYEFEAMLPHVQLVIFENCGHVPMMEKPEDFNAVLASYLHRQCNN